MTLQVDLAPSGKMQIIFPNEHYIYIPFNEAGLYALKALLINQHMADKRIAMPAALTQAQVEDLIKKWKLNRPESEFEVDLEELGL